MQTKHVAAAQLKVGDHMVLGTNRRIWEVRGTSRAVPQTADRICIFGPRINGTSLRWFFLLDEQVEVVTDCGCDLDPEHGVGHLLTCELAK